MFLSFEIASVIFMGIYVLYYATINGVYFLYKMMERKNVLHVSIKMHYRVPAQTLSNWPSRIGRLFIKTYNVITMVFNILIVMALLTVVVAIVHI